MLNRASGLQKQVILCDKLTNLSIFYEKYTSNCFFKDCIIEIEPLTYENLLTINMYLYIVSNEPFTIIVISRLRLLLTLKELIFRCISP
jgi:hypothetical protein